MEEEPERAFEQRALPHFVKSMSALLCVLQAALVTGEQRGEELDVAGIQGQVELSGKEADLAAALTDGLCDQVDRQCELATAQHGQVGQQYRRQSEGLQELQGRLRQLESEQEAASGRLQTNTVSLRQADDALRSARAKVGEKQTGRDVGIGLSFLLPCVGIPMAVAFEKERKLSKTQVTVTSDDRSVLHSSISKDEQLLLQLGLQLPELRGQAQELERKLQESQADEQRLQGQRQVLAETQGRLRDCRHFLSCWQGKLAVLGVQCKHLYRLDPVLPFLEEAALQGLLVPSLPPFQQPTVQRLLGDLRLLLPKVKEQQLSRDSDYLK
ncbi:uncharacterized protein [Narcine bancroftii]